MIDQGAIFNHTMSGQTRCFALNNASRRGHIDVVKLLVERGANLKANWAGMTALDHAIAYDKVGVANYLRSVGAKTAQELQG